MQIIINKNMNTMKLPNGKTIDFSYPQVMGILNVTPDSFSDGGKFDNIESAVYHAKKMIEDGADIIDIGGESARPGSEPVDTETEKKRVIPVIEKIRQFSEIPISIDTTKAKVAELAIISGADIINDISALGFDRRMVEIVKKYNTPIILMHMLGEPKTMQKAPEYEDCIKDVKQFFVERIDFCDQSGIDKNKIIIDPGIGFGKRLKDNLNILKNLNAFVSLGYPVLMGASRKSFIGMIINKKKYSEKTVGGSLSAIYFALQAGCKIVRVHDVAETVEAVKVFKAIESA